MEILADIENVVRIIALLAFIGACALFYQHNKDK